MGSHSPAYQMSAETGSPGRLWVQIFLNFRIEPKRLGLERAKGRSGLSVQMERDYYQGPQPECSMYTVRQCGNKYNARD